MQSSAIVLREPGRIAVERLPLVAPAADGLIVAIETSGISSGTEKLLFEGRMPTFPGMGYPLVPGYESVGRVVWAGAQSGFESGERVFVPGANCFKDVRGLFGGAASHLATPAARVVRVGDAFAGDEAILLALAATAHHALKAAANPPELIIGHGVVGRLIARLVIASGAPAPTVWEISDVRADGAHGYQVVAPDADPRRDYGSICDASGDPGALDAAIARLAPGGQVVLAGFYNRLSFAFPPAFMKEASIRIAAQWQPQDMAAIVALVETGRLSLGGLITHHADPRDADHAYRTAFGDAGCLKMILDWRTLS
jgi:bacteriochlorophyllide a dehydrogenase